MTRNLLETPQSRAKLLPRRSPYFFRITKGVRLGYYRGKRGGSWIVRIRTSASSYRTVRIGAADGIYEADGIHVFDFFGAYDAARSAGQKPLDQGPAYNLSYKYTVAEAVADYLGEISVDKSPTNVRGALYVFNAHIVPELGSIVVDELTTYQLKNWFHALSLSSKRVRKTAGDLVPAFGRCQNDDETRRKRKATANRILTCLKAALNRAFENGRVTSDVAWRKLKPFRKVDSAIVKYLSISEQQMLVRHCDIDFRLIVMAALLTGCRYSEIGRLRCGDFNAETGMLHVLHSKTGSHHVALTTEGQQHFELWVSQRPLSDKIFLRAGGQPWKASQQRRRIQKASERAGLSTTPTFHILRHTYASQLAMKGVSMATIAQQLGHADTRITTKHYAHLSPDYVSKTIRENFPILGL